MAFVLDGVENFVSPKSSARETKTEWALWKTSILISDG